MPFKVLGVWAEDKPLRLAVNVPPMVIEVKPKLTPVRMRQYPIPMGAQEEISHHLQRLLNYGLLSQSAWNTPLLSVQRAGTNDYCPVQDLQADNQAAVTLHLVVRNHFAGPDISRDNLLLMLGLKRCILLQTVGTCEPTHLCFPMGGPPLSRATAFNLDLSPTGFQELPNHLWNCSVISFARTPSRGSWLHTLTSSLQRLTTKTVLKGQSSYSISYGKLDTRYLERRLISVKTRSSIWGFTSPKAVEPWCRKKTSCLFNPDSDYKKTNPWILGCSWVLPNLDT
jgi:hypothetical protein